MKASPTRSEKGVLKLVHPGRYVEIHRKPITAAEVMKKNPRHCIARPDVFKYPWIVVRPESVLCPGSVFYIVPYRAIYRLLKARGLLDQPSWQQNQFPKNQDHHCYPKETSPLKSWPGNWDHTMHQNHNWCHVMSQYGRSPQEQDSDW